jgi:mono/diheme cytochrome c family protein
MRIDRPRPGALPLAILVALMMYVFVGLIVLADLAARDRAPAKSGPQTESAAVQVPPFANRSKIPLSGRQGPPGEAASLKGNAAEGEKIFARNCASCHGPQGTDKVTNPGSDDGTVPPLNPIDPQLKDTTAEAFASNIDRLVQHGSIPDGPRPALFMPDWGDSKTLTQRQVADVEAYIMRLNGVSR